MYKYIHASIYILYKSRWTVILILHDTDSTHTGADHVWSLCPCCLDCLEDVHSSFNFDSLNFRHTSDEHTTARHAITSGKTDNHAQHTRTALHTQYIQCNNAQLCPLTRT